VVEDIKWFLLFLTLTMIGFGLAFYSLFRQDRDRFMDFTNIWHSLASMFSYMLAMFDYNVFYNSTNPTAAMLLFIMFEFVMNVLLFNVLIASMTNSFSKITQVSCLASQRPWSATQLIMFADLHLLPVSFCDCSGMGCCGSYVRIVQVTAFVLCCLHLDFLPTHLATERHAVAVHSSMPGHQQNLSQQNSGLWQ